MCRRFAVLVLVALAAAWIGPTRAQFLDRLSNPEVLVAIEHPPGLGLAIERIAFAPARGACAEDIVNATIAAFVSSDIEVLDRDHLDAILTEHDLTLSGYVDREGAAEIGRILGPSALVFVTADRCVAETDRLTERERRRSEERGEYTVTKYVSRTRAYLKGSVQTVDLATGRIFAAKTFEYTPEASTHSYDGFPDPPPEFEVLDVALASSATYIRRLFLPWTEQRDLVFFNNKKCGLKEAYRRMKAGDYDGAHELSLDNLEACRRDPDQKDKMVGRALYNVGIGQFLRREYEAAADSFREAIDKGLGEIADEALASAEQARDLEIAMQEIVERAEIAAEDREAAAAAEAEERDAGTMSNDDVVALSNSGLPKSVIVAKIRASTNRFDTSTDALIALAEAGVDGDVIAAMIEAAGR